MGLEKYEYIDFLFVIYLIFVNVKTWSMNKRTTLEDDLAKYSTPMYRAPEMLGKNEPMFFVIFV